MEYEPIRGYPLTVGTRVRVTVTVRGSAAPAVWEDVITAVNIAMAGQFQPYYRVSSSDRWYYHAQVSPLSRS